MRRTLIPPRIIPQIQLMVILRVPPLPRLQDLRRYFPLRLPPLLGHLLRHDIRLCLLLGRVREDGAAVLCARVHALAVGRGGVVHLVEELEEGGVGEGGGVEGHLEGFGVWISFVSHTHKNKKKKKKKKTHTSRPPRTHGSIARTTRVPPDIPHFRIQQPFTLKLLPEQVLDAPEAAGRDGALLRVGEEVGGGAALGVEGDAGGRGEGAEEAGEEVGHRGGHDEEEEGGGYY